MNKMMIAATVLASSVIAGSFASATPASAAAVCGDRQSISKHLAKRFSEHPSAQGISGNGAMVELFASKGGDTWTMVVTKPDGRTCVVAAGEYWDVLPAKLAGEMS